MYLFIIQMFVYRPLVYLLVHMIKLCLMLHVHFFIVVRYYSYP